MHRDNHELRNSWAPVRRWAQGLLRELPELSVDVTASVRDSIPAYAPVDEPGHRGAVEAELRRRLAAVAERRPQCRRRGR